jgi:EAL domain-containing protein (putative c-di-GMP-specific phosphodiesterase class I)
MGSAVFPDDAADAMLLIQQADHALYVAKGEGRDRWQEFSGFPEKQDAKGQADLFLRLTTAVAEERITAFYQPIVDALTGQVVAVEALARWHDERHGWVPPDTFIPLAEEKGLISKLGQQVLAQGLEQLAQWRRKGHPLTLSINLSKPQVLDGEFGRNLVQQVKRRRMEPEWITLEITERESVLGHALGRQRLKGLAAAGFRLSVDDFGAGYSSFELVGVMPFDELKIHLGLIQRIADPKGKRIVQAIVEMAKTLDLRVVAEGVETEAAARTLAEMGAHKLQGYFYSKPLQAGAFLSYLEAKGSSGEAVKRAA